MLIGQLSKKTGLSRDTIRFYEKQGLIPAGIQENPFNNYKQYVESTVDKLLFIKKLKGFGFTLKEIRAFLVLLEMNEATCKNVAQKFSEKISLIDAKIKALQEMKAQMLKGLENCPSGNEASENCPMVSTEFFL